MANDPFPDARGSLSHFLPDLRTGRDRRSGGDRRISDRRVLTLPVERERRSGKDRRNGRDRRFADRRVPPAAQFTWEETRLIQLMVSQPGHGVGCPRCEGALLLGPPEAHGGVITREVHCTRCRNSVVIVA
jgi:hypothetical protein